MGREWNDKLRRRLQNSICKAQDQANATRLLITDLEPDKLVGPFQVLVEVLGIPDDVTEEMVIGEFLVSVDLRPKVPRYRDDRGWPTPVGVTAREMPVAQSFIPCKECGYHHCGTCTNS